MGHGRCPQRIHGLSTHATWHLCAPCLGVTAPRACPCPRAERVPCPREVPGPARWASRGLGKTSEEHVQALPRRRPRSWETGLLMDKSGDDPLGRRETRNSGGKNRGTGMRTPGSWHLQLRVSQRKDLTPEAWVCCSENETCAAPGFLWSTVLSRDPSDGVWNTLVPRDLSACSPPGRCLPAASAPLPATLALPSAQHSCVLLPGVPLSCGGPVLHL